MILERITKDWISSKRSAEDAGLDQSGQENSKKTRHEDEYELDVSEFNTKFPNEIISHIFAFLPFKDLLNASLVCTKWRDHISDNTELMKKIVLKYPKHNMFYWSFNRRYEHFEFRHMLILYVKFMPIRHQISSIKLMINTSIKSFSTIRKFIDLFPNLKSLELIQTYGNSTDCFGTQDDRIPLSLVKLQHLTIHADTIRFAAHALGAIKLDNKLNSLKFVINGDAIQSTDVDYPLMMNNLKKLLNSQDSLKSLEIGSASKLTLEMQNDAAERFDPKFQLEELRVKRRLTSFGPQQEDATQFMQTLLSKSKNCKILHFDATERNLPMFVNSMGEMAQLKELKIDYQHRTEHYWIVRRNYVAVTPLLNMTTMKCQLKRLDIAGLKHESDVIMKLLRMHKDSLKELNLRDEIPFKSPVWQFIEKEMKLKVLRSSRLPKKLMSQFKECSIQEIFLPTYSKASVQALADGKWWQCYRERNPSFKSISISTPATANQLAKIRRLNYAHILK